MNIAPKLPFPPIPLPSSRSNLLLPSFLSSTKPRRTKGREFPLPSVASIPYQPIDIDYLEEEFHGNVHGVAFEAIGDECVAKLRLENGDSAIIMLPSGLITSYKPLMWHGGTVELLHSSVSEDRNRDAIVQGGVSLVFDCESADENNGVFWSTRNWNLHSISGNPRKSIKVELKSSDPEGMVEMKYIVTLEDAILTSELMVSNNKQTSITLMGSLLSHLTVSTPEATYALGLEGSNFCNREPFSSTSAIIPPDYGQGKSPGWSQALKGVLSSGWGKKSSQRDSEEIEGEETDNYKQLTEQTSRIYTNAPRNFTIIDRGRRNSVVVGRDGFDELYMFSPGSNHVYYGEYSYICVGPSAILKPIVLDPQQVWRGSQLLFNPNQ